MADTKYKYECLFFHDPVTCDRFQIYQLSELFCNENTNLVEHDQLCNELTYVISGNGIMYENGQAYHIRSGDCFFSLYEEIHKVEFDKNDPLHFYCIGFDSEDNQIRRFLSVLKEHKAYRINFPEAESILKNIFAESWISPLFCNEMIGLYFAQLILLLSRKLFPNTDASVFHNSDASMVYQISAYLQTHICEINALSKIESAFNYSYNLISREFNKVMGQTLRSFFLDRRMEYAKELLSDGKTVTEVAELLGYSSIHPFSRAYKKYFALPSSKNIRK